METFFNFLSVPGNYHIVFDYDISLLHTLDSTEGVSSAVMPLVIMVLSVCFSPQSTC